MSEVDFDPSNAFNPFSTVNSMSAGIVLVGLIILGVTSYLIAKQHINDKDSTPERVRTLNFLWSLAYLSVVLILLGFAMAYGYD
jgi:uncharacterized membrane protein YidH (DUF202 family)